MRKKGVKSVVVISDGFRERGEEGAAIERELREITLGHGMRLVGPNCMGIINTDPAVSFNGTFSRTFPPRGSVAFLSQSGGMGLVILEYAANLNLGISSFVSVGNRADVSFGDLLRYWEKDPATKVILLYLESFGNARRFTRTARRVSATKPILAVKGGRTSAGLKAASSIPEPWRLHPPSVKRSFAKRALSDWTPWKNSLTMRCFFPTSLFQKVGESWW